jgi:hypothetical protein
VSGPLSSSVLGGLPAAIITSAALVIAATGRTGLERQFGRWAVGTIIWAVIALTVLSPGLATFFAGLPNDQYHGWLSPIIFAVIGIAVARLIAGTRALVARTSAIAILVSCLALSLASMPPFDSPDGGWPKAAEAAARIRSLVGDRPTAVMGVAKSGAALAFPLIRDGEPIAPLAAAEILVVTCDPIFETSIGARCGGPAEVAFAWRAGFPAARLIDRFADSPRRVVCVFSRR